MDHQSDLKSCRPLTKLENMTEWIMDLKFKIPLLLAAWFYFEKKKKKSYVNDISCLNRSTSNACYVLDLLTWRQNLPSVLVFSFFFFFNSIFILYNIVWTRLDARKKENSRLCFLCFIGLVLILRLNYILLLRCPFNHSSWSDEDCLFGSP